MKKIYLTLGLGAFILGANAQQTKLNSGAQPTSAIYITEDIAASVASSTTTIIAPPSFASPSCSLTGAYAVNSSTVGIGGFVAGNNYYGDTQKAMRYTLSGNGLMLPGTVSQVYLYVGKIKAGGSGAGLMSVKIYADNAGAPGVLLGTSATRTISTLAASSYSTNVFTFVTPVALTTDAFFVSADFSGAAGDTLSLVSTISSTATPCAATNTLSAWDADNANAWGTIKANWGLTIDLGIFAVVTADLPSGVKNSNLNAANVLVSPNPSNGLVNIAVSSKNNEDLSISVVNALGQIVVSTYSTISSGNFSLDLSNQNNGVYFITIFNGQEKTVKRVVLNK